MPELDTFEYYSHRENQERTRATLANDPAVATIHRVMADRYATLMRETEPSGLMFTRVHIQVTG